MGSDQGAHGLLSREGTGAPHESASKEAETDVMVPQQKRAMVSFRNPFGMAPYTKNQRPRFPFPPPTKQPRSKTEEGSGIPA